MPILRSTPASTTEPQQPALPDAAEDASDRSANGNADATQPIPANGSADATTQTVPAGGSHPADQDATQRLEPVGKPRIPKGPGKPRN